MNKCSPYEIFPANKGQLEKFPCSILALGLALKLVNRYPKTNDLGVKVDEKGYCRLSVVIDGKKKHYPVHRLVAKAFIPNPYNYPQVDHIDSDKTNNHISNLRWCTNKQNSQWRTERRRKEEQWKN